MLEQVPREQKGPRLGIPRCINVIGGYLGIQLRINFAGCSATSCRFCVGFISDARVCMLPSGTRWLPEEFVIRCIAVAAQAFFSRLPWAGIEAMSADRQAMAQMAPFQDHPANRVLGLNFRVLGEFALHRWCLRKISCHFRSNFGFKPPWPQEPTRALLEAPL